MTIKRRKNAISQTRQKKLQKLFSLHSSREKFPTHHQHFFVPGLRTKNHKMFYDRKKDIIWCFQQTYLILLHTRKKVIAFLFYFEKVVLFDWQAETCSNILTLSNRPSGRPTSFSLCCHFKLGITGTKYPEQTFGNIKDTRFSNLRNL